MKAGLKKIGCVVGAVVGFTAALPGQSHAALTISDSDVTTVGGLPHYVYSLSYNDIGDPNPPSFGQATGTKLADTAFALLNLQAIGNSAGLRAVTTLTNGNNDPDFAAFVEFKYDFTTTNYLPTSVTFTDRVNVFQSGVTAVTAYSFDDTNWTTLNSPTSTASGYSYNDSQTVVPLLAQPVVYYRVMFTGSTEFTSDYWAVYQNSSTPTLNVADFTLTPVPEPTVAALGAIVLSGLALRRSRSRRV